MSDVKTVCVRNPELMDLIATGDVVLPEAIDLYVQQENRAAFVVIADEIDGTFNVVLFDDETQADVTAEELEEAATEAIRELQPARADDPASFKERLAKGYTLADLRSVIRLPPEMPRFGR